MWVPTSDQTKLELGAGLYGQATGFAAISRPMSFARGEGLPGQAWREGRPVLLTQFEGSHFQRIEVAHQAGLSGGLAVPVFLDDALKAVLVFYVGDDLGDAGAVELWHNVPRVTSDMTLVEGYYGRHAQAFEEVSRDTYLPRGTGLPGLTWQRDAAVFMPDIGQAGGFLRRIDAAAAGIKRGLGVPCPTHGLNDEACVVSFLSAPSSPIARRIESWALDVQRGELRRAFGFCESAGALSLDETLSLDTGGLIAQAWRSGTPQLSEQLSIEPAPIAKAAASGIGSLVAWPVVNDEGQVAEVVVLYF